MDNLNCDIVKSELSYCDICEDIIQIGEHTAIMKEKGGGDFIESCLPCIDKIRTELIKKNPGVKLL